MAINMTKVIQVLSEDGVPVSTTERMVEHESHRELNAPAVQHALVEAPYPRDLYGGFTIDPLKVDYKAVKLKEAAAGRLSTPNFPDLLRAGVKFDVFSGYNERPLVYPNLVQTVSSNRPGEEYADDVGFGIPGVVAEGQPYPLVTANIGGSIVIPNAKRGYIIEITEELMKFDLWGKVRDLSAQIGRSMRLGRENSVFAAITAAANYNGATILNDGSGTGTSANNKQTLTFSPKALNTAMAILTTMKDRTSGQYLGVMPDTLIVTPLLERFARMLISSPELMRVGGGTNDVYGGGMKNPFFGYVSKVVVSPMFGNGYEWALIDTSRFLKFQEVEGLRVENEGTSMTSESWLTRDVVRYKARDWYGVGVRDSRFGFYSDSTTAPLDD